jgi:hypothetical protein
MYGYQIPVELLEATSCCPGSEYCGFEFLSQRLSQDFRTSIVLRSPKARYIANKKDTCAQDHWKEEKTKKAVIYGSHMKLCSRKYVRRLFRKGIAKKKKGKRRKRKEKAKRTIVFQRYNVFSPLFTTSPTVGSYILSLT